MNSLFIFVRMLAFFVVLALLEVWFFPLPLAFIALFLYHHLYGEQQALLVAFILGFLFDIILIRTLGTTSFLFLILLFATTLYKRKYASGNFIFLAVAIFLSILILEFILYNHIAPAASTTSTFIAILLFRIFSTKENPYESWYRFS